MSVCLAGCLSYYCVFDIVRVSCQLYVCVCVYVCLKGSICVVFYSKPLLEDKLYELRFGHQEVRLHGVSPSLVLLGFRV